MKLTNDFMRGIVPDYTTQVLPEDGQVYAFNEKSFAYTPTLPDYAKALDYTDKNMASPKDASFQPIYGPKAETTNANVSQAQPILSEVVVTKEVPVFDFKKAVIIAVVVFIAYKYFKKGRA